MATIRNVISYVDAIKPNAFDEGVKVQWVNEVEGYIQTEVMMLALADTVQYDPDVHMDTVLLVKPPHDKLYSLYLCALVDFSNGEYDKYNNTMQMYNKFLGEYIKWYTRVFHPADGGCVREGYYLSAYTIATRHGFEGTEEEWIASLKGEPGDDAYDLAKQFGYTGTREEFAQDQAEFAGNAAQVRIDREAADQAATKADSSAAAAAGSASDAAVSARNAAKSETNAASSASSAKSDAGRVELYREDAMIMRDDAVNAASEAVAAAQRADVLVDRVEEFAGAAEISAMAASGEADRAEQTVKDTLQTAKDSGEFDGKDGDTPYIGTNGNWWIGDTDTGVKAGGTVTSVNGVLPDESGNVEIELPEGGTGGGITQETDPTVPDWAKQPEKPTYTASEVGALPASTKIPAKTSDLQNDSGFITAAVNALLNYYKKSETYTRTEVDAFIAGLDRRLNAVADSDDATLDQLSEIVAYIKANKSLIDSITTSKVSVSDIINNLTTADAKKPLSAAQGKELKALYDSIRALYDAIVIPTKLPNPYSLTFTGAATGTYDGSSAVTVHIPVVTDGGETVATEVYMRVSGGYIQYSTDNATWKNVIAVADLKGDKGDKGDTGEPGADYVLTAADKTEIAQIAVGLLPKYAGEVENA